MTDILPILLVGSLAVLLGTFAAGSAFALVGAPRPSLPATGPGAPGRADPVRSRLLLRGGLAVGLTLLVGALALRSALTGHAPWSNLHEFSVAFAAALVAAHLVLNRGPAGDGLAPLTAALGAGLVGLALALDDRIDPLVPALQQPFLLTVHVGSAALAYAVAGIAFVAAVAELVQRATRGGIALLPTADRARAIAHRAVLVAFPLLTVAIVLGSVWANLAWRSYWSNDPKELAAAATWLVFGAYLHAAGRRDRWERLAPWLIVLGFVGVLFTYIGAGLVFVGEHSYAAP